MSETVGILRGVGPDGNFDSALYIEQMEIIGDQILEFWNSLTDDEKEQITANFAYTPEAVDRDLNNRELSYNLSDSNDFIGELEEIKSIIAGQIREIGVAKAARIDGVTTGVAAGIESVVDEDMDMFDDFSSEQTEAPSVSDAIKSGSGLSDREGGL